MTYTVLRRRILLRTKDKTVKTLHENTINFIKQFARDHFIKLRGTDEETRDYSAERITCMNWYHGGFHAVAKEVEKITFHPDHFSFNYKGATISGPLKGVNVETQVLIDGEETDCERDDIEAAVEKACGFALDPSEFEEPEIDF